MFRHIYYIMPIIIQYLSYFKQFHNAVEFIVTYVFDEIVFRRVRIHSRRCRSLSLYPPSAPALSRRGRRTVNA